MTTRVVLAWCWLMRTTRLDLALYALIGAYRQQQRQPSPPVHTEAVPPSMTRVEWDFVSGADSVRCQNGKCLSVVNGRYIGEQ